jgi:hypothetical protein
MIDSNVQFMSAARHQVRTSGTLSFLMGVGCLVFAVCAYFETGGFLPYFLGLLAIVALATGIFRLSRGEQYPNLESPTGRSHN